MVNNMVSLKPVGTMGPLPSSRSEPTTCLIMLGDGLGKVVSVKGSTLDAAVAYGFLHEQKTATPFKFLVDTLDAVNVKVKRVVIDVSGEGVLARIFMKAETGKTLRITTANVASAINMAVVSGKKILMSKASFDAVTDTSSQFSMISNDVGCLWPLPKISKTVLIQAVSEISDASIGAA